MDLETYILTELKRKEISVKDAIERIGVSKQTFYNKIKSSKIDKTFLTKVKESLNIEVDLSHLGVVTPDPTSITSIIKTKKNSNLIPFYNADFMAGKSDAMYSDGSDHPDYYMDVPEFAGCIAFRAFGDSMERMIKSSSILFGLKLDDDWKFSLEYGQIYGITMKSGLRYLKYIRKSPTDPKGSFLLKSENSEYDDFEIKKEKIKNIWLIQGWIDKRA